MFARAKDEGHGVLITYLMGGDPSALRSLAYLRACAQGGAGILEIGVPFSDPIADGPTIQAAGLRALKSRTTPETVLRLAAALARTETAPIVLMAYANIIFARGPARFLRAAQRAGVAGLIVPDLPMEEARELRELSAKAGIDLVLLAAPSADRARLREAAKQTQGFLYLVSRYGVTGARDRLPKVAVDLIRLAREEAGGTPIAVGFGLSTPGHLRAVRRAGADGAIVGSSLVELVARGASPKTLRDAVNRLAKAL